MAGIEPASESLDPRMSTSVVACSFSPFGPQATKDHNWLATGALKLLFHTVSGVMCGTPALCRPGYSRLEIGVGGRDPDQGDQARSLTMQRVEERKRLCDWHLKVCADFSRSAPLDSQSGVTCFRRSPSSPSSVL